MKERFQSEDYKLIHKLACNAGTHKLESKRKKEQIQYNQARNNKRSAAQKKKMEKAAEKTAKITAVKLNFDEGKITKIRYSTKGSFATFQKMQELPTSKILSSG